MKKYSVAIELNRGEKCPGFTDQINRLIEDGRFEVKFLRDKNSKPSHSVSAEELQGVDFYYLMGHRLIDESTFDENSTLQWIGRFGAGFENVDIDLCTRKGVLVTNSPVGLRESVAELALAFILNHVSKLSFFNSYIREKHFNGANQFPTICAGEKTLGLLGAGGIAQRLTELVAPMNMKVLAYDPFADKDKLAAKGIELTDMETLLKESDIVSSHLPLTNGTKGMIKEEHFRMMKPSAFFLNTSRGGIYDDAVLAKILKEGVISGAGLDVFEDEPHIENNPLLECETAILSPHIAGASNNQDTITAIAKSLVDSTFKVVEGDLPDSIINPEATDKEVPAEKRSPSYKG